MCIYGCTCLYVFDSVCGMFVYMHMCDMHGYLYVWLLYVYFHMCTCNKAYVSFSGYYTTVALKSPPQLFTSGPSLHILHLLF